jgi:hypothetical protein
MPSELPTRPLRAGRRSPPATAGQWRNSADSTRPDRAAGLILPLLPNPRINVPRRDGPWKRIAAIVGRDDGSGEPRPGGVMGLHSFARCVPARMRAYGREWRHVGVGRRAGEMESAGRLNWRSGAGCATNTGVLRIGSCAPCYGNGHSFAQNPARRWIWGRHVAQIPRAGCRPCSDARMPRMGGMAGRDRVDPEQWNAAKSRAVVASLPGCASAGESLIAV